MLTFADFCVCGLISCMILNIVVNFLCGVMFGFNQQAEAWIWNRPCDNNVMVGRGYFSVKSTDKHALVWYYTCIANLNPLFLCAVVGMDLRLAIQCAYW